MRLPLGAITLSRSPVSEYFCFTDYENAAVLDPGANSPTPDHIVYCKAQYLINFNMLSNFGVTPPNFTYSNVYGGLGVVGGISCTVTEAVQAPDSQEPEMPNLWDLLQMMK